MTDTETLTAHNGTGNAKGPLAHIFSPPTSDTALCGHKRRHELNQSEKHDICVVCNTILEQSTGRPY